MTIAPPPQPTTTTPRFAASDGAVWRWNGRDWFPIHPGTTDRLLAGFERDAANTGDWFAPFAARLADELKAAIREAEAHRSAA